MIHPIRVIVSNPGTARAFVVDFNVSIDRGVSAAKELARDYSGMRWPGTKTTAIDATTTLFATPFGFLTPEGPTPINVAMVNAMEVIPTH